jgi:preprotein translocase subunit SecE
MSSQTEASAGQRVSKGRGFLHEVVVELQKTTWPTWREATRLTMVVLVVLLVVGVYVGLIDFILTKLTIQFGLLK